MNSVKQEIIIVISQGSWKTKLRDRFKWLRRRPPSESNVSSTGPPPPKKKRGKNSKRIDRSVEEYCSDEDDDEYEDKVKSMIDECKKAKKECNSALISTGMVETFQQRRKWIAEQPTVLEILEKFPALENRRVVSLNIMTI